MINPIILYRLGNLLYRFHIPFLPQLINYLNRLLFSCWIPSSATIGKNVTFGYGGLGVIVHNCARIGDHVLIAQNVTIGGKNGGIPIIGDNVYIGAGAVILGGVHVGRGSIVGANAVVVKDVQACCIVGGVPAVILRTNIDISDYEQF